MSLLLSVDLISFRISLEKKKLAADDIVNIPHSPRLSKLHRNSGNVSKYYKEFKVHENKLISKQLKSACES